MYKKGENLNFTLRRTAKMTAYTELEILRHTKTSYVALASVEGHDKPAVVKKISSDNIDLYKQLQTISNEHITEIYSAELQDGQLFIIEEYIDGTNLDEYIISNKLNEHEIINLLLQLCDGLKALHYASPAIIHRDLKPSNVLVTSDGILKIIDFDASRNYKSESTHDTVIMGTFEYAPPEQYGFSQTDVRSDIYSVGAIMYKLFFNKILPKDNRQFENTINDTDVKKSKYYNNIMQIISRCTMFDPDKRYSDIREVEYDLKHFGTKKFIKNTIKCVAAAGIIALALFLWNTKKSASAPSLSDSESVSTKSPEKESDNSVSTLWMDYFNSDTQKYEVSTLYFLKSAPKLTPIYIKSNSSSGLTPVSVNIQSQTAYRTEPVDKKYWRETGDKFIALDSDYLSTLESNTIYKVTIDYKKLIVGVNIFIADSKKQITNQGGAKPMPGADDFYLETPSDLSPHISNRIGRKILNVTYYDTGKKVPKKYWHVNYDTESITFSKEFLSQYKDGDTLVLSINYKPDKKIDDNTPIIYNIAIRNHPYVMPVFDKKSFTIDHNTKEDIVFSLKWNDAKGKLQYINTADGKKINKKFIRTTNDAIIISKDFFKTQKVGNYTYIFEFGDVGKGIDVKIK